MTVNWNNDENLTSTVFPVFSHFSRQRFLSPGEKLLGTSLVRKYCGMSMKKQQLLLTDKPRLIIVDIKNMSIKQEIPLSKDPQEVYVEIEDQCRFSIRTVCPNCLINPGSCLSITIASVPSRAPSFNSDRM